MLMRSRATLAAMLHPRVRRGGLCAGGLSRSKRLALYPRNLDHPARQGRGSQRVSEQPPKQSPPRRDQRGRHCGEGAFRDPSVKAPRSMRKPANGKLAELLAYYVAHVAIALELAVNQYE